MFQQQNSYLYEQKLYFQQQTYFCNYTNNKEKGWAPKVKKVLKVVMIQNKEPKSTFHKITLQSKNLFSNS